MFPRNAIILIIWITLPSIIILIGAILGRYTEAILIAWGAVIQLAVILLSLFIAEIDDPIDDD